MLKNSSCELKMLSKGIHYTCEIQAAEPIRIINYCEDYSITQ